jgi:hypothetical protein
MNGVIQNYEPIRQQTAADVSWQFSTACDQQWHTFVRNGFPQGVYAPFL